MSKNLLAVYVSSRAPVWGASFVTFSTRETSKGFKSCPRVGGIISAQFVQRLQELFQVVPPCGGHRGYTYRTEEDILVSSRAPVWGASFYGGDNFAHHRFQVVPPCGGHRSFKIPPDRRYPFQVVPPCGGHPAKFEVNLLEALVSSRAPVWGASRQHHRKGGAKIVSSRAPVWGASVAMGKGVKVVKFQVVPPCGGHLRSKPLFLRFRSFKSCPRVGGILEIIKCKEGNKEVSSRAPVWGASCLR